MPARILLKLAIIPLVAIMFCSGAAAVENAAPPADNDDSYKLPMFVPKAAMPQATKKVTFEDKGLDNDEIYTLPKRAALKPSALSPSAGPDSAAQQTYNQQYQVYQQQMKVYDQQMLEYKKQLAAQQQQAQGDNDSAYVLPGTYSPTLKNVKLKPAPAKPAAVAQPKPQIQTPVAPPVAATVPPAATNPPATARYQPTPAAQYNQKYNYSDQNEGRTGQGGNAFPNYYY